MVAVHTSVDDHIRCIKAFERILAGQNRYYAERLQDPEFVTMVTRALEAEKAELEELLQF